MIKRALEENYEYGSLFPLRVQKYLELCFKGERQV